MRAARTLTATLLQLAPCAALATQASSPDAPNVLALGPAAIAIGAALLTRQAIPALFAGVWLGAWLLDGGSAEQLLTSVFTAFSVHTVEAIADRDHALILAFTFMLGGAIGIIAKSGGFEGVARHIARLASTRRSAQVGVGVMGLTIFFDDYSNTLVVGPTMRPITDRLRISREKLAFLVDSTTAPIACVALVSTWIGFQIGLIAEATAGVEGVGSAYGIFLNSLAYSFYPLLALTLVFLVALTGRDFGPMLAAERAALSGSKPSATAFGGENAAVAGAPPRALDAVLPILALLAAVVAGLAITGEGDTVGAVLGSADAYVALCWASLLCAFVAAALALAQRKLPLAGVMEAWMAGAVPVFGAAVILVLAWSVASVTQQLGAADYLVSVLSDEIPLGLVPAVVFVIAAATAFATGTSWGVMAILTPLSVPLVLAMISTGGTLDAAGLPVLYATVASIIGGAVWGDHCSPISDTTVLSSVASGCDLVAHVNTQLPYALLAGSAAVLLGLVPTGFGVPWPPCLLLAMGALYIVLRLFGRAAQTPRY